MKVFTFHQKHTFQVQMEISTGDVFSIQKVAVLFLKYFSQHIFTALVMENLWVLFWSISDCFP